ncbi:MAG: ytrH [Clostridia bacterium]|jgi:hypothetical protein|nr:ytrH [Clostridia bacterium]
MVKGECFIMSNIVYMFLISFGVVIGASLFSGIAAMICNHPPLKKMLDISLTIKIWAVAIAIGGTFSSFEAIEKGIFNGEIKSVAKQIIYIAVALLGANLGYGFIKLIKTCGDLWLK